MRRRREIVENCQGPSGDEWLGGGWKHLRGWLGRLYLVGLLPCLHLTERCEILFSSYILAYRRLDPYISTEIRYLHHPLW